VEKLLRYYAFWRPEAKRNFCAGKNRQRGSVYMAFARFRSQRHIPWGSTSSRIKCSSSLVGAAISSIVAAEGRARRFVTIGAGTGLLR